MNTTSNAFIEVGRLQNEFAASQADAGQLHLELAALQRDEAEINQRLQSVLQACEPSGPILLEVRDLLKNRSSLLTRCAEKDSQSAALCSQSAVAIDRLVKEMP